MRLSLCVTTVFAVMLMLTMSPVQRVHAWEDYELDLFDLVEDVAENFYEFFSLEKGQDASMAEIRRSYRKLSMQWHPDKNTEAGAEKKFRQIAGVYEVLKDETKKKRYNDILEFGLPDWKTPIYYFRKARKLGSIELIVIILLFASIGHYFVMWAHYWEKKLTIGDRMDDVKKRLDKKRRNKSKSRNIDYDDLEQELKELYDSLPTPSIKNSLPFVLGRWAPGALLSLPFMLKDATVWCVNKALRRGDAAQSDSKKNDDYYSQSDDENNGKYNRRRSPPSSPNGAGKRNNQRRNQVVNSTKEKEANRDEEEAAKNADNSNSSVVDDNNNVSWSQEEQTALESALKANKQTVKDGRSWDKIAESVKTKSKEECLARFKTLCDNLKQKTQ